MSMLEQFRKWLKIRCSRRKEAYLYRLIERMNDKGTNNPIEIWKTKSDKAYREADRLRDSDCLPILRRMILSHLQTEKESFREAAYYIMSRLLSKFPDAGDIAFYIERILEETNQVVQFRMLVHLGRIQIPETQSMEGIIPFVESEKALFREAAIFALGSQQSNRCREVLCRIAALEDHKRHQGDVMAAQSALKKNGTLEDIVVLERNLHSASRNIRENAAAVIDEIRIRNAAEQG